MYRPTDVLSSVSELGVILKPVTNLSRRSVLKLRPLSSTGRGKFCARGYGRKQRITILRLQPSVQLIVRKGVRAGCDTLQTLTRAEQRYTTTEGKLLALLHGLHAFRQYVAGRQRFLVHTDHWALKWIRKLNPNLGQLARWLYEIDSHFTSDVEHRPGKLHKVLDGLSRLPATHLGNSWGERLGDKS
jgi:hypothetical protein